jgi:chromosome segregation ATPase
VIEFRASFAETAGGTAAMAAAQERCAELAIEIKRRVAEVEVLESRLATAQAEVVKSASEADAARSAEAHSNQRYGQAIDRLNAAHAEVARLTQVRRRRPK